jgi:hypothetical protein
MIHVRAPAVAGTFYELDSQRLKQQIRSCFTHRLGPGGVKKQAVIAAIVPHAGYTYSGPVAAWVYARLARANYVILGPNHQGIGATFAVMKSGLWKTPLGSISIDTEMAELMLAKSKLLELDILPHQSEHSIEVQLPFLQYRFGSDFRFVPICIRGEFADAELLEQCRVAGKELADIIKKRKSSWIILASSDCSHYIPQELATDIDNYVTAAILRLDEADFFARLNEKGASWCGFGPIAVTLVAAKKLGAKKSELLCYKTSGDITGELGAVVGYCSAIFM